MSHVLFLAAYVLIYRCKMSKTVPIYTDNDAVVVMRNMFPEDWNPIQLAYELPPIKVYQPYEVEQILVPDNANCLAVQAFLKICQLKFQIEPRPNAEYMSPSGQVPFIKWEIFLVAEFENIVSFISNKGISPSKTLLSPDAKADMRAYISLVNNVFVNAELYICWVENTTYETITKQRYGSVYPWPLNHLLNGKKRKEVIKKLTLLGWYNKTIDDICGEVKNCCTALSSKLKDNKYFFGDKPTEIDALVYGHVYTLREYHFPSTTQEIIKTLHRFPCLVEHAIRMNNHYGNHKTSFVSEDFEIIETPSKDTLFNISTSLESLPPLSENSFLL